MRLKNVGLNELANDLFGYDWADIDDEDMKRIVGCVYLGDFDNIRASDDVDAYWIDTPIAKKLYISKNLFEEDVDACPYNHDCANCPIDDDEEEYDDADDIEEEDFADEYELDKEFQAIVAPVIKWLNDNVPTSIAVVTQNHAILSSVEHIVRAD